MSKNWIMGFDLGGGGVRCLLVDTKTGARAMASREWTFPVAEGTFGLGFDLPVDAIWAQLGAASREAMERAGAPPKDVAGVGVSAVRFGNVILDDGGEVLFAVPNRDARAAGLSFQLANDFGVELLSETGLWPMPIHASARLLWLKDQRPEVLEHADCLLSVGDWVNERLCGARVTDPSQAGCTALFHLERRKWNWDRIEALGLSRDLFPEIVESGSRIGELSASAAAHLGLAAQTPVAIAGGDTQCGLLGAGATAPGALASIAGTTAPVMAVCDRAVIDDEGRVWSGHHVVPGRWVIESNGGPMGETLTWMARVLYPEAPDPELRLLAEAETGDVGSAGMLSTLGAEVMNARAPSMPVGQITLSHMASRSDPAPRRQLARSLVEGYACAVRANIEQLEGVTGSSLQDLRLSGGLSQSGVFGQILADVLQRPVEPTQAPDATALGAALCAGVGGGLFPDLETAAAQLAKTRQTLTPQPAISESSQKLYTDWIRLRDAGAESSAPAAAAHVTPFVLAAQAGAAATGASAAPHPAALITASFDDESLARLRDCADVEYASFRDHMRLLTGPGLVEALAGKQVFVTEIDVVDADSLAALPDLRVIAACRGDAVNVDVDACTAYGIPVLFAPGRNADAVADLAVAFLISLARKLPAASVFLADPDCTAGNMGKMGQAFGQFQGYELWRKTIGLVGAGAVGRAVASRLAGFGARLLVFDPYVTPERAALAGCTSVGLDTLLAESDFVSLHAAVTDETRGMIGAEALAKMKFGSFLVNTARAALVDEDALVAALAAGHLAGAALDTFAVEPPGADHPLVQHGSVISTPHVGGNTNEVAAHQGQLISEALLELIGGGKPRCVLNPETLETFDWAARQRQPTADDLAALANKPGPAVSDLQRDSQADEDREEQPAQVAAPDDVVATMREILERFCQTMAADESVVGFSSDKEVTLYFVVPDLGLDFHIAMNLGEVTSALGPAEGGANVQLRMRGEILDGMFAGTVNSMECAMQGDIAFTGDAAKAMTIQHLQADMKRIYTAVRDDIDTGGSIIPALAAIPQPGVAGGAPRPVVAGDVREELVAIVNELYESQVITATGGNVSVRVPDADGEVWITPSQLFKGDLSPEVLVRIDLAGQSLDPGARSPSSEWSMHTQIFQKKPEARAVVHAHAPNATILANTGLPFLPISTEAAFFGDIPRVPFIMPGSGELADAVSDAMKDEWAVLMINHGLIVSGRSLRRAADMVEIVERSAELILGCYAVGKEPPVLPADAVETLRAMGDLVA